MREGVSVTVERPPSRSGYCHSLKNPVQFQEVAHLLLLRLEITMSRVMGLDFERDALNDIRVSIVEGADCGDYLTSIERE